MKTPKYSVGEKCLLQSVDMPEKNGDVTIVTVVPDKSIHTIDGFSFVRADTEGVAYVLDVSDVSNVFWHESCLRKKHAPSQYDYAMLMESLKYPIAEFV